MSKYIFLILFSVALYADDLDLGDDFVAGEVVKAEDFNTKFNKLETVSRLVKDSDLIGSWTCKSVTHRENFPFTQFAGGFIWYLDGNITFSETDQNPSTTSPKNWSSDVEMIYDSNSFSGTYTLFGLVSSIITEPAPIKDSFLIVIESLIDALTPIKTFDSTCTFPDITTCDEI